MTTGWRAGLGCCAIVFALAAGGAPAPGQSQRAVDMNLEVAGFVMRPANTARKMERLKTLPAHRFVARTKAGVRYFVYADPVTCQCAFVGSEQAMNRYRELVAPGAPPPGYRGPADASQPSGVNPMQDIVHDMNRDLESDEPDDIFHPGF